MLECNQLNKELIKNKDDLHKTKNEPNESEKIKKELNCKNNEVIKIKSELNDKKNTISDSENTISDLKNKNLLINKYEQEIHELKKNMKNILIMEKKIELKKIMKLKDMNKKYKN